MDMKEMIAEGLLLIQNDSQHDLNVSFRCRLFSSLDEINGSTGRTQRTKLVALGVEKAMPLWESHFPTDHTPHLAIKLADDFLTGKTSSALAETEMGKMWTHCDNLAWSHSDKQCVIMVGYGAVQVIREALSERHFGCEKVSHRSTDRDVDPYDQDSLFCAAIAYSGGSAWQKASDAKKRLEFWTWWLKDAIPTVVSGSA